MNGLENKEKRMGNARKVKINHVLHSNPSITGTTVSVIEFTYGK